MPTPEEIQTCINNLTSSSDITQMVILSGQTNDVTTNRSIPVTNVAGLPDLLTNNISAGTIFFVQSLCIPVVASVGCWTTLDNRVIRRDYAAGDLWGWGLNTYGLLLADGTVGNKSSPVSVVGGFCDWCQVSAGDLSSTVAIRSNGTLWAWGSNYYGQLGDGTVVCRSSPVSVVGGFTDWCQATTAEGQTQLAVRKNGTLWSWGRGLAGMLGDNTVVNKSSPVSVVGGFTDWCQVSAGRAVLAVRQNGTAWGWGCNNVGRIGDNSSTNRSSPVSVVGGFTDWCQVSASVTHSMGVRQNGTLWAWGANLTGQLGTNNTTSRSSPVSVVGGFTDWCQVSSGNSFSLAIRQNGTAWAWGCNTYGRLGDNTTVSKSSPVSVVGGFTDWCQVSAGVLGTSAAVRRNGTLWAWGQNQYGQIGDCTTVSKSSPVSVVGGFTDWCQVSMARFAMGIRRY